MYEGMYTSTSYMGTHVPIYMTYIGTHIFYINIFLYFRLYLLINIYINNMHIGIYRRKNLRSFASPPAGGGGGGTNGIVGTRSGSG